MEKKKVSRVGWIKKDDKIAIQVFSGWELEFPMFIHTKRGKKKDWTKWPPKKVRITIEEL